MIEINVEDITVALDSNLKDSSAFNRNYHRALTFYIRCSVHIVDRRKVIDIFLAISETFLTKLSNVPSCAKAIVGNKRDFLSKHTTPVVTEGKEIAKKMSIPFFFTNAITGENVEHVIVSIAAEALVAVSNKTLPSLYLAPIDSKSEIKQKKIEDTEQKVDDTT